MEEVVPSVQYCEIGGEKLYFHTWDELLKYIETNKVDSYAFIGGPCRKPINGKFYEKQGNEGNKAGQAGQLR